MIWNGIKCLNPRRIYNKYLNEYILCECGKCEACRNKKSFSKKIRCQLETQVHKYCYFVTLTYSNRYLPLMRLVRTNRLDPMTYDVYRYESNLNADDRFCSGEYLGSAVIPDIYYLNQLKKKVNMFSLDDIFPCLDYRDVQLFIKRLRKRITNEKIRMFVCGEYGPVHFRPHYHLLLWFTQEETAEVVAKDLHSLWPYGRIDSQLSQSKVASYVSSYVNGSQYLPTIFKVCGASPFTHHSRYLGEAVLENSNEELFKNDIVGFTKRRVCFDGLNTDVILWRSFKARWLPKCSRYSVSSEYLNTQTYRTYAVIKSWTKEAVPLRQARFISDYVKLYDFYHPQEELNEMFQHFRNLYTEYTLDNNGNSHKIYRYVNDYLYDDKFEKFVYRILLNSRYFLVRFSSGDWSYNGVLYDVRKLDYKLKTLDYENLKNQLKLQKHDSENIEFYYHNHLSIDRLKMNKHYKAYCASAEKLATDRVKHKKLNDLNKIFNYG